LKRLLFLALAAVAVLGVSAGTSAASNATIVIPFEKHWVSPGHYVGTAGDNGTIDMQVSNSSVNGNVQHFIAAVELRVGDHAFTARLAGTFNFSTGKTVLNGTVADGWMTGAQVHEKGQLVGFDPLTFIGTVQVMPASAD
jgi:hypothetical protein